MGRGQVKNSTDQRMAAGKEWTAFLRRLWTGPWLGEPCFACGCAISPGLGEAEHRISVQRRPDLTWSLRWMGEPFLVPVHGSGRKRCPVHDIACNMVIGSNAARRDELGRSVPLTPAEIDAAVERARSRPRSSAGKDRRAPVRESAAPRVKLPERRVYADAGRPW
jgi:hypothetical protein